MARAIGINHVALEVVDYRDVQFTKAPAVVCALLPEGLEKSAAARGELDRKGLGD